MTSRTMTCYLLYEDSKMASGVVRAAIAKLFDEECSFSYTERGGKVVDLSRKLLEKVGEDSNVEIFDSFCQELISSVETCLVSTTRCRSVAARREKAQVKFHQCRLTILPDIWSRFFIAIGLVVDDPLLLQSVSQHIFDIQLIQHFQAQGQVSSSSIEVPALLTREEENILRYACGFVPFKLRKRYEKQSSDKAAHFVECLSSMAVNGQENFQDYTTEWIRKVNRGGLFCTNDQAYELFCAIEREVRVRLPQHLLSQHSCKSELIEAIVSNEDVQFMWSLLSADIDSEAFACELLAEMIKLWVTIRGFSTVSEWVEQYKASSKTTTQKSKGLRKTLAQSSAQID